MSSVVVFVVIVVDSVVVLAVVVEGQHKTVVQFGQGYGQIGSFEARGLQVPLSKSQHCFSGQLVNSSHFSTSSRCFKPFSPSSSGSATSWAMSSVKQSQNRVVQLRQG